MIVIAAASIAACAKHTSPEATYFPLSAGAQWQYRITETTSRWIEERELRMSGLGKQRYPDDDYLARANQHDTEYFFRVDRDGVYRVGKRTLASPEVVFDAARRFVLKYPLEVGQRWYADSHPYVIERMEPFREEFSRTIDFQMIYTIESMNETVQVPAGEFTNCIKVTGEGKAVLLAELAKARYGANEAEIDAVEWYAPGVGLVKLERLESFPNRLFVDGVSTMELVSFSP